MQNYFADLHVHIGISESGKWIKIPTSNRLTVRNILDEASRRKGMQIVGVVDAMSPLVSEDLTQLVSEGLLELDSQGGYRYADRLTLLLGAEIETSETGGGTSHTLIFLPDLALLKRFSTFMAGHIRNINLSSQNAHMPLARLVNIAADFGAAIVPAHVFTPHKSLYGACATRMAHILSDREMALVSGVELGLSADSFLADRIDELADFTFLSNSDAHSLEKIAREYNVLTLQAPTFQECCLAFARKGGRRVAENYGLDPRLGKYHRTFCQACDYIYPDGSSISIQCPQCGGVKMITGVFDRIETIADRKEPQHPSHRPLYHHQVPLTFVPGVGKKVLDKLITAFGSEMKVLHCVDEDEIRALVGAKAASALIEARSGSAVITAGGGGVYGKLAKN